jgi:hypothetical protein
MNLVRSATLPLQVLISGSVQDSLTPGEAPRSPLTVRLLEIDPVTSESKDYPIKVSVCPNGTFAFFGVPEIAFPGLDEKTYRLRLEASAPNYETTTSDVIEIGPISGQPELVTRSVPLPGISDIQTRLFTSDNLPLKNISLSLQRKAVRLRGRVIEQNDLSQGVEDAKVSIEDDSDAVTDSNGKFEFSVPMPVQPSIRVTVSATDFDGKTFEYELNYNQPINSLLISLTPASEPEEPEPTPE